MTIKIIFGESKQILRNDEKHNALKYSWVIEDIDNIFDMSDSKLAAEVEKNLNERFKSVTIYFNNEAIQSFKFDDPADEAAFLLWSSDRLKI